MRAHSVHTVEAQMTAPSDEPEQADFQQPVEAVFNNMPPGVSLQSLQEVRSTQLAVSDSVVTMVAMDKMTNPEIRERFMAMVENRDKHDKDIENRAFERMQERADRKLEADIQLRNDSMNRLFILFLLLGIGFSVCAALGVDHKCLWAFGVFFAPAGFALFREFFQWRSNKQRDER